MTYCKLSGDGKSECEEKGEMRLAGAIVGYCGQSNIQFDLRLALKDLYSIELDRFGLCLGSFRSGNHASHSRKDGPAVIRSDCAAYVGNVRKKNVPRVAQDFSRRSKAKLLILPPIIANHEALCRRHPLPCRPRLGRGLRQGTVR